MDRERDIKHGEHTWRYESVRFRSVDLQTGDAPAEHTDSWYARGKDGRLAAGIMRQDDSKPLDEGNNAFLLIRAEDGTWERSGVYSLKEALRRGNVHMDAYNRQADARSPADNAPARGVWDHIRKAAQRRQEEKTRNKDRDGGRERDG